MPADTAEALSRAVAGTEAEAVHGGEGLALTPVPSRGVARLAATSYKWVSFSPMTSPSFSGEGSQPGSEPPSGHRCGLGCGRLGSGVTSRLRRCGETRG